MTEIDVASWEAFEEKRKEIRQAEVSAGRDEDFLFRGLSDSTLPLATTLERAGQEGIRISEYYRFICRIKPQIETYTGRTWEIAPYPEVEKLLRDHDTWTLSIFPGLVAYSYMVHLRHHGFPSPLLDWTRSPYIAAYFAFRSPIESAQGKVSICVFSEQPERYKSGTTGRLQIRRIGPFVTTHRRHYLQQSDYTMCALFGSEWCFGKHEDVFALGDPHQDVLWRFNIPWTERRKVLKFLDSYNLNAFTLFDSEESMMETLALRELDFR
ncbi:MAG TPA: FRG domain-containing protein [Candidatus Acidoferrales bacterium]|jgi:hypothetical protein|nr:FRG domain-containing protein [Candidatus Acidoferrales bacterium]